LPTVQHNTLEGADAHEPKGASTAAVGKHYRSNGLGSGSWVHDGPGWGQYGDLSSGDQTFTTTRAKLQLDGLATTTEETHLPFEIRGTGSLWDGTLDKITPIAAFDSYNLRIDIPITAEAASPTDVIIELDIGGAVGTIVTRYASTGKGTPYTISVGFPVYAGTTFLANGATIYISTDTGTVTALNPTILIQRVSAGDA